MSRYRGDTEVSFIGALAYWGLTVLVGWCCMPVYQAWQTGISHEFTYRKLKMLNELPAWLQASFGLLLMLVLISLSVSQTARFVGLLRR